MSREAAAISILDAPRLAGKVPPYVGGALAAIVHAGLVAVVLGMRANISHREAPAPAAVTQWMDVDLPQPTEIATPEPLAPKPPRTPRVMHRRAPQTHEAPPPAAAQAGHVLSAPDDVVNDVAEAIVTGTNEKYAGGTTESDGTSSQAVHDSNARAGGVEGGTGTDLRADRSRAPRLAGGANWDCPFPSEADDASVDHAMVSLRVEVAADGHVIDAVATADPGNGFAREARRCALQRRWSPGLDRAGVPTRATTLVNVRFDR